MLCREPVEILLIGDNKSVPLTVVVCGVMLQWLQVSPFWISTDTNN